MNPMLRRLASLSAVAVLLSLVASAPAQATDQATQHEEAPAWDQEKVGALAEQLASALDGVYKSIAKTRTGADVGSGQANAFLRLKDNVRVARTTSRQLAKMLQDGKGRDETTSSYRRLMTLVRDARETGRTMFLEQPTLDQIEKANEALDAIAPYYPGIKRS